MTDEEVDNRIAKESRMKKQKINEIRMLKYWTLITNAFKNLPKEESYRVWKGIGIFMGFIK